MERKMSEILRELRTSKKATQSDIAKMLGLTTNAYQSYERGTSEPSCKTLRILADFYDVTVDYLLGRDTPIPTYLTSSELAFENAIIERYKQLPEHFRKSFLQGVMEAVEYYQQQEQPKESTMVDCGTIGEALNRRQQETEALRKDTA
ncbi:MAG: helix-turn-helix transcriptional regulator [Oscillospiraceae bacterium]|nr:helix-turn-helix transcriptional regulator [Oscillospiraceae bacterium]